MVTTEINHIPSAQELSIITICRKAILNLIAQRNLSDINKPLIIAGSCAMQPGETEHNIRVKLLELKDFGITFTQRLCPIKPRSNSIDEPTGLAFNGNNLNGRDANYEDILKQISTVADIYRRMVSESDTIAIELRSQDILPNKLTNDEKSKVRLALKELILGYATIVWIGARDIGNQNTLDLAVDAASLGIPIGLKHGANDHEYAGLKSAYEKIRKQVPSAILIPILRGFDKGSNITVVDIQKVTNIFSMKPIIDTSHGNNSSRSKGSEIGQVESLELALSQGILSLVLGVMTEVHLNCGQDKSGSNSDISWMDPSIGVSKYVNIITENLHNIFGLYVI